MKCYLLKIITFLTISSAIEATKEICPCVPLNTCPDTQQFKKDDAKYFATILKCNDDGLVRCCKDNELQVTALRRMDEDENLVMTDEAETEDFLTSTTTEVYEEPETTENFMLEPEDDVTTSETPIATTVIENIFSIDLNLPDNDRKSKFIDEHVDVVYPNLNVDTSIDANKKPIEDLFIIFPNNDVETVLEEEKVTEPVTTTTTNKPYRRVVVRKRLRKKERTIENLEGAESQVSKTVVEPQPIDVEKLKKRLVEMLNSRYETTTPTSVSTEGIEDVETTTKKKRKKLKKYRKSTTTATTKSSLRGITSSVVTLSTEASLINKLQKDKTEEITEAATTTKRPSFGTTMKPKRKLLYDTSSRKNFLKKPHIRLANNHDEEEEPEEHEEIHDHENPIFEPTTQSTTTTEEPTTTTHVPVVLKLSALIDSEHKSMIETVHKSLKAIHAGVDMKIVKAMIDEHQERVNELRKNPPKMTVPTSRFTTEAHHSRYQPTRPFRGNVRFNRPISTLKPKSSNSYPSQPRTRNLSRTRSTTLTPNKSVRKTHQRQTMLPHADNINLNEELNMPLKQEPLNEFHGSPLYGITVDKENYFDIYKIEQLHETFKPSKDIQNGFFPVISNGTPSTVV
ncbi:unnamed protein product [Chironomus riparius]|uniref:Uncharacterized protein n=1 Tax=Chironomus riparius TaxID=315576 RepID=A0A9N9RWJ7_9DIPT|nr:unnamed protein product [Chironomus riparius]